MSHHHKFKISNTFNELELLCATVNDLAQAKGFPEQLIFCLNVCLEEMLSNIIKYSYDDDKRHEIRVKLKIEAKLITVTIIDDGHAFNPLNAEAPDIKSDIQHRQVGGIGIFLTCKMAHKVTYRRKRGKNILKILLTPHVVIT